MQVPIARSMVAISAALFLFTLSGSSKTPLGPSGPQAEQLSGKYVRSNGDYLLLDVSELGSAEGYYEHNGRFGQLFGRVEGGRLLGYWVSPDAGTRSCDGTLLGSKNWGRLEITFEDGRLESAFGACDEPPTRTGGWTAQP